MKVRLGDNRKRYRKGVFRYCWETGEWVCRRQSEMFLGWFDTAPVGGHLPRALVRFSGEAA